MKKTLNCDIIRLIVENSTLHSVLKLSAKYVRLPLLEDEAGVKIDIIFVNIDKLKEVSKQ